MLVSGVEVTTGATISGNGAGKDDDAPAAAAPRLGCTGKYSSCRPSPPTILRFCESTSCTVSSYMRLRVTSGALRYCSTKDVKRVASPVARAIAAVL